MKIVFLLAVSTFATAARADPPTTAYRTVNMDGFEVLISPDVAADPQLDRALDQLHYQLIDIEALVTPAQMTFFRTVPFWIENNSAPAAATLHRSKEWLSEHGKNPDKEGAIEISNIEHFTAWSTTDQPMLVLHELAHAYSLRVLRPDYRPIADAYQHALDTHLYESIGYVHGGERRAYALTDKEEYFSELTEAYFGRNDFYPFRYKDLRWYDPVGFKLMQTVWGERKL